jgi:dTDP-4-dehydrorhamnose reductase
MKILITGSNGFLGTKLVSILSNEFDVVGLNHSQLDITNIDKIIQTIKDIKPDIIINTVAFADVDKCETDKEKAHDININGIKNIIQICKELNIKLIHISTDFVFDGKKGNYSEEDETNPVNYYGQTKLEAEKLIQESGIDYIIARVCMLYGHNGNNSERSFVKWVYENLMNNKPINVFTDHIGTPTLIDDVAQAIITLIKKEKKGIYHVSGTEKINRHNMALKIAETFKFDKKLINPITSDQLKQTAKRPKDTSLNISKLNEIGINMSNVNTGLKIMKEQMQK